MIFGKDDFIHRHWDYKALVEIMPGDTVVFGCALTEPKVYSYDDSDNQ